jgi:tetratricopeptide (TPR) repeat protein
LFIGTCIADNDLIKIDSLNKLVGLQSGRERIETLITLSEAYREVSFDKSLKTGSDAEKFAADEGFEALKGKILLSMGESASISGDFALALDYYSKALKAYKESDSYSELAETYNKMGLVYKNLAEFDKAIESLIIATEIEKEHNLVSQLAGSIANLATIYFSQGDFNKAMDGYHQAQLVYKDLNDTLRYAKMTMNVGLVYWQWDKNDMALDMLQEAKKIFEKKEDFIELGRVYNNIGMLYYQDVRDTVKALEYFENSLSIRELLGNQLGMAVVLANIGNVYRDKKQFTEAFDKYDKALRISEAIGYKEGVVRTNYYIGIAYQKDKKFKESNRYLSKSKLMADDYGMTNYAGLVNESRLKNYAALGDYEGFMKEFSIYSSTRDSLSSDLNEMTTREAEARYKINELLPEIERLEALNKQQLSRLTLYRYSFLSLLLVVFVVTFYLVFRRKPKTSYH